MRTFQSGVARHSGIARRGLIGALAATPLALLLPASAASAAGATGSAWAGSAGSAPAGPAAPGIPAGYAGVDPRTARRVPLWQELGPTNPIFDGDPPFEERVVATIPVEGYLLEQFTSLGTHTGTHISAPAHFIEGGRYLSELDERFTLMPLAVIDVRARIEADGGDFSLGVPALQRWETEHGRIPAGGCVLLLTGFADIYFATPPAPPIPSGQPAAARHHPGSYFDPAPGFTAAATAWLFERRGIVGIGSDTFGPDATSDGDYGSTSTALAHGGITVENVGTGLPRMRPHGDWIAVNGGRPRFSGFQMGITGFTVR